jgi:hypothetical protein
MKKVGLTLIALIALVISWVVWCGYTETPKEEGIAHLTPATIKPFSDLTEYSSLRIFGQTAKPAEIIDLPVQISDSSKNVFYFSLPIGKNNIFVITQKTASGQVKAWMDTNLNQRFSDEKPLSGTAKKRTEGGSYKWEYVDFGKNRVSGDNFTSAPFYFICDKGGRYIIIQPVACVTGKIRLGKYIYRVAAVDGDYEGKLSTPYEPSVNYRSWGCDTFVADHDTYALFERNRYDSGKMVPLGKYFKFTRERYGINMPTDGKNEECYYSIDLSVDGKTLRMQPAEPAMGTLKIGQNKRLSAQLLSGSATQGINLRDEIKLPAGLYQMHWGELTFTDKQGEEHKLRPDFRDDIRKGQFTITAGQMVTLNPGPPFTVKSEVSKQGEGKLGINARLVGNEGEEYGLRISRSAPEPQLKILNENKEEIHSGQMEFG